MSPISMTLAKSPIQATVSKASASISSLSDGSAVDPAASSSRVAFGLNGLGAYLVASAQDKDLAVVQGISLVLVTAFVVVNLIVDLLYAVLDPRVSAGSRAR
jgi:peptide/nickel transport system permease protein